MANLILPYTVNAFASQSTGANNFRGQFQRKVIITSLPDLKNGVSADISKLITRMTVNYTMSLASELSFDVVDPDLKMSKANYFILGRDVIYETYTFGKVNSYTGEVRPISQLFEIASVSVAQGPGGSPIYSIVCYTKAVQQMKRDKKPGAVKGNGTQFIRNAAAKYGLEFYGEETSKAKKITKAAGSKQSESLWDVMTNLAGDAKFVLFEVDGILVFASEKFLLHKWGTDIRFVDKETTDKKTKKKKVIKQPRRFIPLQFPNSGPGYVGTPGIFELFEYPSISKSANDPYAADGSCTVNRINATQIRPGMTAYVGRVPNMSGYYLIDSVSFAEMTPDPVSISFRTLTRDEEKEEIKLLPLGKTYEQTSILDVDNIQIQTTAQAAKSKKGTVIKDKPDSRIVGDNQATEDEPYRYPIMPTANISKTYKTAGFKEDSTGDKNALIITGNIDLWNRPILPLQKRHSDDVIGFETLRTTYKIVTAGSEYRAIILPRIFTDNDIAVRKSEDDVKDRYDDDGGFSGSALHLGVLRGATRKDARLNARDYMFLLDKQQELIMLKRFDDFDVSELVNTPGGADSIW